MSAGSEGESGQRVRVGRGAGRQRLATRHLSIGNVSRRAGRRSRGPGATRRSPRAPCGSALAKRVDREDAKRRSALPRLESRSDTHQHRDGDDGATRHERPQDAPEQRRPVVILAVVVRGAIGGRSLLGGPAVRGVLAGGAVGARHGGGGGTRAACEVVCRATIARETAIRDVLFTSRKANCLAESRCHVKIGSFLVKRSERQTR